MSSKSIWLLECRISDGLLKCDKTLHLSFRPQQKHLCFKSTQCDQKHLEIAEVEVNWKHRLECFCMEYTQLGVIHEHKDF